MKTKKSLLGGLLCLILALQLPAAEAAGSERSQAEDSSVSVSVIYSSQREYPGKIDVYLNGTEVGDLRAGSGMQLKLIPGTENALLFRSGYFGVKSATVRLDPQQPGTDLTYSVYVEPFSWKVLRADRLDEDAARALSAKTRFRMPQTSMADPDVYPDVLKEPWNACAEQPQAAACEEKLLDEMHVPRELRAVQASLSMN